MIQIHMSLMSFNSRIPVDSILEAVLTVSPNRQYLGIINPTTPATQGPTQGHACVNQQLCIISVIRITTERSHQSAGKTNILYKKGCLTCVKSYSDSDRYIRHVSHFKCPYTTEDIQSHVGNLSWVAVPIGHRQTWCHHVGITYCLNLDGGERMAY